MLTKAVLVSAFLFFKDENKLIAVKLISNYISRLYYTLVYAYIKIDECIFNIVVVVG